MNAISDGTSRPPSARLLRGGASGHGIRYALFGAFAASIVPCMAFAQGTPDARSVVETVLDRRAERLAGVENYTVVQTLSGAEATLYFERVEVDGVPVFRIVPPHEYEGEALEKAGLGGGAAAVGPTGGAAGGAGPGAGSPAAVLPPLLQGLSLPGELGLPAGLPLADGLPVPEGLPGGVVGAATGGLQQQLAQKGMDGLMKLATPGSDGAVEEALLSVRGLEDLAATGRLEGMEVVDGVECFVLRTDRIRDSELARQMGGGTDFALRSLTIWIDTEEYVPRRTVATGEVTVDGRPQEMTLEIVEQDYRRVEGMLEPFRRVIRILGMGAMLAAEDPEKAEQIQKDMQENLAKMKEMEEMLARMPPEQRRMAEAQMGPALERMKQLGEGGIGDTETVIEVEELRVNAGPPTLFGTGYILAELDASMDMQMVARVGPAADASGRVAGWTIQLLGASEGHGGGIVQLAVFEEWPAAGEIFGNARASFRWEDGKEAQFIAPEGGARITITSNDGRRIAGEFFFEASGQIRKAGEASEGRTVVHGRFESPVPPAMPGIPPGGPGPT